jgi:hypothetical protein
MLDAPPHGCEKRRRDQRSGGHPHRPADPELREMIRSISYSRYFKMATPMDTGRAATPNQATLPTPVARRQLSACRTMKASDSRNTALMSKLWTSLSRPVMLSTAARPPLESTRTGCAASARDTAAAVTASPAAKRTT